MSTATPQATTASAAVEKCDRARLSWRLVPSIPLSSAVTAISCILFAATHLLQPGYSYVQVTTEDKVVSLEFSCLTIDLIRLASACLTSFAAYYHAAVSPRLKSLVNDDWVDLLVDVTIVVLTAFVATDTWYHYLEPWTAVRNVSLTMLILFATLRVLVAREFNYVSWEGYTPTTLTKVGTYDVYKLPGMSNYTVCPRAEANQVLPTFKALAQASEKEMAISGSALMKSSEDVPLLDFFCGSDLIGHGAMVKNNGKIYIMTAGHVYTNSTSMQARVGKQTKEFTMDFVESKGKVQMNANWDTVCIELTPGAHSNFGTVALQLLVPTTRQIIYAFCRTDKGLMMSKGGILWDRIYGCLHTASTHPGFSGTPILTRIGSGTFGVVGVHLGASLNPKQESNRFSPVGFLAYKTLADVYTSTDESPQLYRKDIREWEDEEEEDEADYAWVYETENHDYFIGDTKVGRRGHRAHKSRRHAPVDRDGDFGENESRSSLKGPGQLSKLAADGKTPEKIPMSQKAPVLKTQAINVSAQKPMTAPKVTTKSTTSKKPVATAKAAAKVKPKTAPKKAPKEKAKQAPEQKGLSKSQKQRARKALKKKMALATEIQTDGSQAGPTSSGHPVQSTGVSCEKPTSVENKSTNPTNLRESRATRKISSEAACGDSGQLLQQLLHQMFQTLSPSCKTDLLNSLTQASKLNHAQIPTRSQAGPSSDEPAMLSHE